MLTRALLEIQNLRRRKIRLTATAKQEITG